MLVFESTSLQRVRWNICIMRKHTHTHTHTHSVVQIVLATLEKEANKKPRTKKVASTKLLRFLTYNKQASNKPLDLKHFFLNLVTGISLSLSLYDARVLSRDVYAFHA